MRAVLSQVGYFYVRYGLGDGRTYCLCLVCNEMGGDFEAGAMVETHLRTPSRMEPPDKSLTIQRSALTQSPTSGSRGRSKMESPLHTHSNLPGPVIVQYPMQTTEMNGTPGCPCSKRIHQVPPCSKQVILLNTDHLLHLE